MARENEITNITELAFLNTLDLIPMIQNTGENNNPLILQMYERNAAVLDQSWTTCLTNNLKCIYFRFYCENDE